MPRLKFASALTAALMTAASLLPQTANACTRTLYVGADNTVITGRNMDWMEDMQTDLWIFPRGMARTGQAGPGSPEWTAKYGSVIASGYNIASADGMNEKGLVANLLYLAESDYGNNPDAAPMSIGLWTQYVLDNFATVAETVAAMQERPLRIIAPSLPNGSAASLHLSISDPSGDSAIFEYVNGELVIHHGKQYKVMTNSPTYGEQLALDKYWQKIDGTVFLPGSNSAADRFVRASFLLNATSKDVDKNFIAAVPGQSYANQAVAQSLSVQRGVSVPLGVTTPGQPNIASTLWRTVADQTNLVYYFDSATTPNTFWVNFADVDFSETAKPKKLPIAGGNYYAGNAAKDFVEATPFTFLSAE